MRIHSNKPPIGQALNWTAQNDRQISGMDTQEKFIENNIIGSQNVDNPDSSRVRADVMVSAGQLLNIREAKVQAIKKSVAAGTYVIYPYKIAEKMLKWI